MRSSSILTLAGYGCAVLIAAEFYLLPVLIGWVRHAPRLRTIAVIDLALGWTVIGWLMAFAMAVRPVPGSPLGTAQDRRARRAAGGAGLDAAAAALWRNGVRQPDAAPPLVLPASPNQAPLGVTDAGHGC